MPVWKNMAPASGKLFLLIPFPLLIAPTYLKDKWRNMAVSGNVPGSRERVRTARSQGLTINPPFSSPEPLSAVPPLDYDSAAEPSNNTLDKKIAMECSAMIFEALSSIEDPNGPDVNAILCFIEQRYEVPQNFRRSLTTKLRRLVLQGKLEKVNNGYKIKVGAESSRQDNTGPNNLEDRGDKQKAPQSSKSPIATETLEDAASYAAYAVAVAENMKQKAAKACEEANTLAKFAEENMAVLKLAEELYEQCLNSPDGTILLPP